METIRRKSSFRTPRAKVTKTPSSVSTFAMPYDQQHHHHMATPMLGKKSELWRGSVEVISDVELTQSDTELMRSQTGQKREKRKRQSRNCLSGFAMKSGPVSDNPADWDTPSLSWKRFYLVTSDSILVLSNPSTFLLDQRMKLHKSRIREVRLRGRGVLYVQLHGEQSGFLLRFRDRAERRQWYAILQSQSMPNKLPPRSAFPSLEELPPAKQRKMPSYFPLSGTTATTASSVSMSLNQSYTSANSTISSTTKAPRRRSAAIELLRSVKAGFRDLTEKTLKRRSSIRLPNPK